MLPMFESMTFIIDRYTKKQFPNSDDKFPFLFYHPADIYRKAHTVREACRTQSKEP